VIIKQKDCADTDLKGDPENTEVSKNFQPLAHLSFISAAKITA
jgi:hypothetical protein